MYLQHFRFNEFPFGITPDTSFFMNRAGYQDALNVLLVALRSGEGFIKVTGEVGVGKTILCRKLMNSLGADFVTAYIHNPYIKPDSLLFAIADELSVPHSDRMIQNTLLKLITRSLLEKHKEGKQVVICLDEVQAMPVQTLEALRLLTNLETEKRKLIQVVLFGQPELDALLNQPSIRQLKQRITFIYRLLPLNRVAMHSYIRHRLEIAGCAGRTVFNKGAIDSIHRHSKGIPRLVNIICHKALISAYGEGVTRATQKHVKEAVMDMEETQPSKYPEIKNWFPTFSKWLFGTSG
ncbi:MAG: AAA family ATPase [Gammaproteobacteria bacterium RBG_16_51_14]|nr:MAG: AAA family ATPase [Gammaproteobacteria bacterium RBG_16_51_14]